MSDWGSIVEAIESAARSAVPSIPAGTAGFERGVRVGQDLRDSELPHVFAHNPTEESTELDYGQKAVRFSIQLDMWTRGETQEQAASKLDAIRDAIQANRSLGGAVDKAWVSSRALREFPSKPERAGVLIVSCEWTD